MKNISFIKRAVTVSLFSAIIAVSSFISIPFFGASLTLQSFAVFASLFILGGRLGTVSVSLYIALGAVGLPIFSGFEGGVGKLFGITGGFIFGFLLAAVAYWIMSVGIRRKRISVSAAVIALLVLYASGTLWYVVAFDASPQSALLTFVLPFIPFDAAKLLLAFFIAKRVKNIQRH